MIRRFLSALLFCGLCAGAARGAVAPLSLIDIPTADVADHYAYFVSFRLYSEGGVINHSSFGVLPRLNVGFGLDAEKFIGTETVDLNRPTLNVKFRFFDGKRYLPAMAAGFDGQGYFFDKVTDEYRQREKGLYLVGSGEIITPGLTLHGGGNIYDFSDDRVYGFVGLNYLMAEMVSLSFEADNLRNMRQSRLNLGGRVHVTPSLSIDVAARDLWAAGRDDERIVRVNYFGSF